MDKLISNKDGRVINRGDIVEDFRGDKVMVSGWYSKPVPSTGRVIMFDINTGVKRECYPGVIDATIVQD